MNPVHMTVVTVFGLELLATVGTVDALSVGVHLEVFLEIALVLGGVPAHAARIVALPVHHHHQLAALRLACKKKITFSIGGDAC